MSIANFFAAVLWSRAANYPRLQGGDSYRKARTSRRAAADCRNEQQASGQAESADSPRERGEDSRRHRQRPADSLRLSEAVDNLSERKQRQAVRNFFLRQQWRHRHPRQTRPKSTAPIVTGRRWKGLVPMSQIEKKRSKRNRKVTYQGFAIRRAAGLAETAAV
jgi:hypothetical protein